MQVLLIIIGAYLFYKFVADFVIPIYRTTKRVQDQFRAMQEHTSRNNPHPDGEPVNKPYNSAPKNVTKEYIDFEEIKD